ncbi:MAG: sigma-70 family RNA polymerase sigma factor [Bacteroidota bacterium]
MSGVKNDYRIAALLSGNANTVHELYQELLPKVTHFVEANNGSYSDAKEVFQEALLQIITRAKTRGVSIKTGLDSYIFITCRNLWYQELNKRNKILRNDGLFEIEEREEDSWETDLLMEQQRLFEEKLLELSDNCGRLLKDYFGKVTYADIVKKYNYASENTAFQRVFKCKKKLTKLIEADPRFKNLKEL